MSTKVKNIPRAERLSRVQRVVVKIGSSSVAGDGTPLHLPTIRRLVREICQLREAGVEVALVSSGAVAAGMGCLGLSERPRVVAELQAVAAVGQNLLVHTYEHLFARRDVPVGQVLLTAGDILDDRQRYVNLRNTFRQLFRLGAVPVINENDSVGVVELKRQLGDNDMLAAYVANLVQAQLLIILSDVEGLYRRYSKGRGEDLIHEASRGEELSGAIGRSAGRLGQGGMATKVQAAELLMACGEMTIIAHARKHKLTDIVAGADVGTLFLPGGRRMGSRKRWIGFASPTQGAIVVDDGAVRAITQQGRSLLPAGVTACEGTFGARDVVRIEDSRGREVGRGVCRYPVGDLARILGRSSPQVRGILGRPALEVVHRDDLVLT
ncbi:MAG TPA: glutamate 5-kinase [Candidatus Latescibacteria bacterium]|jgi:glutamate 5-kinase|nr:glutamate 5-kinase [Candidatus Latescibacterota bacterium]HJP33939.1 glutamate 5-kinase [Candidatus Latescibacterota bacterium]